MCSPILRFQRLARELPAFPAPALAAFAALALLAGSATLPGCAPLGNDVQAGEQMVDQENEQLDDSGATQDNAFSRPDDPVGR